MADETTVNVAVTTPTIQLPATGAQSKTGQVLHIISLIVKVCSFIAGCAAYANFIPKKWMSIATITFAAASILKDTVNRIGDLLDNGKADGSFSADGITLKNI